MPDLARKEAVIMSREDPFEEILTALHRAALNPAGWSLAAGLIEHACRLRGNVLVVWDGVECSREAILFAHFCFGGRRDEDLEREYFGDYWPGDERIPRLKRLREGQLVPTGDLYTDQEKETSATYTELLARTGMRKGFHVRLRGPDRSQIIWALGECSEAGGWSSAQIEGIERLLPHVRHFASIQYLLADAGALGRSLGELLDSSRFGVIQLDRHRRIFAANDRARGLLQRGDGLHDLAGFLRARDRTADSELEALIARALPRAGIRAAAGSMTIRRSRARTRLVLYVNPVGQLGPEIRGSRVAALVLVVDPESQATVDADLVRTAMGLTPAQSRVAAMLAEGLSLREIAAATGRAEGTVRWYLKQIFRRQGISRQTELVRRVLSLEGFAPSDRKNS